MKKRLLTIGSLSLLLGLGATAHALASPADPVLPGLASATALAAPAAPSTLELPRRYVPASASLVAHVDLVQLQRTTLWRMFGAAGAEEALAEARAELGMDPLELVRSVTAYGREGEPECVVIVATPKIEDLLRRFEEEGKVSHFEADGLPLFSLGNDAVGFLAEDGADTRVLVVGEGRDAVLQGARVVLGREPSLADTADSKLRLDPVDGSFLVVATSGVLPGMDEFEPASQVLGLAQGVQFDLGEAGGSFFAHLSLDTGSVESARDVSDMVTGLLAMGRLAIQSNEEVPAEAQELLRSLTVSLRGAVVSVDFAYATESLVGLVQAMEDHDD